jgi:hypothetical protein
MTPLDILILNDYVAQHLITLLSCVDHKEEFF